LISEITNLWLFETGINTRLEVSEITKNTLLEFLHVPDRTTKSLFGGGRVMISKGGCEA
jgi:hypothetical protein